jgi:hypothetical protein
LETIPAYYTELLNWAKSKVDKEKSCLQTSVSIYQKQCDMYREFLGVLHNNECDALALEIRKKAILATASFWWDIFDPILKLIPGWSERRFNQRVKHLKYLLTFCEDNLRKYHNELELFIARYDKLLIEEICLFIIISLFYHSPRLIGSVAGEDIDKLLAKTIWDLRIDRLKIEPKIRFFRFSDKYSRHNLRDEFLKQWKEQEDKESERIYANLNDSYYPPISKISRESCLHFSISDILLPSQESIQMTGKEVANLAIFLQSKQSGHKLK